MSAGGKISHITVAEFFDFIKDSPKKAEFFKGKVFDMAGGSANHSQLQGNTITSLNIALRNQPCRVYTSDMMVHILDANAVFFPDVQVVCDEYDHDPKGLATYHPTVIVEVLSAARAAYDRGGKFQVYMKIKSLREHVLIEQSTLQVDVFSRPSHDADWTYRSYSKPGDLVALPSLGIEIPLADIYAKVVLEPEENTQP